MRSMYGTYPEYHTSLDDRDFISFEAMSESVDIYAAILQTLDRNVTYRNLQPHGEPQLGRRGLYDTLATRSSGESSSATMWTLNYSDGRHDLLDIADRSGIHWSLSLRRQMPAAHTATRARVVPGYVCPSCRQPLAASAGVLTCGSHEWPVRSGIPRFVPESTYADAFGEQWLRHAKTQLDSHTGLPITRDRMTRAMGPVWQQLRGATVLECGAGAGRFTELLLQEGADVWAVDLSQAVEAKAANFSGSDRYHIAQASILDLPFAPRQFDVVFCPGVIQHTPNLETSIAAIYEQVKPGGWLVFDHYRWNLSSLLRTTPLFRQVLKRLPPATGMKATDALVRLLLRVHARAAKYRLLELILNRLSPITSHYATYPAMTDADQREWARLNTHDNLTDHYKHHRTPESLRRTVEALGAVDIEVGTTPYIAEVRCRRPG